MTKIHSLQPWYSHDFQCIYNTDTYIFVSSSSPDLLNHLMEKNEAVNILQYCLVCSSTCSSHEVYLKYLFCYFIYWIWKKNISVTNSNIFISLTWNAGVKGNCCSLIIDLVLDSSLELDITLSKEYSRYSRVVSTFLHSVC